jgi:O-antigen/teichoic acid export membrane protein
MIKSTAVYGGAQVIQMTIIILRSKFIAVFLGSHGMGINAIFQSTIAVISSFSSFGINQSSVRDISQAYESGDILRLSKIAAIFQKLVWLTGGLGFTICFVGSYWFSKLSFNNTDFTWYFILLSFSVFFTALSNGQMVFLQGTRNLKYLAISSVSSAVVSLCIAVPMYYFIGIWGIVISIITSSILLYVFQLRFSKRIYLVKTENFKLRQIIEQGAPLIKLGIVLMFGNVMITLFTYFTNIYIGRFGKIEDVGLYQGVSSITNQSIAIVITVLASDFFPRLSAIYQQRIQVKIMVNQQLEMVSLIIAPIVVFLIVFSKPIVVILLSNDFLVVVPMLRLMSLSLLFRGVWLTMSYIILANGDKRTYFLYDALLGNGMLFIFNIIAYSFWGLQGLGWSFLVGSITISCLLFLIVKNKYEFQFNQEFTNVILIICLLLSISALNISLFDGWIQYVVSGISMILIFVYSFQILNKRIGILEMIKFRFRSQ